MSKTNNSHPDMLEWQYRTLIAEISQVNLHAADDSCPCNQVALEPAEYCLGKHLMNVASLAAETAMMDKVNRDLLEDLASESTEYHLQAKSIYCQGGTWPDLASWARDWRKKLEPLYYICDSRKKVKLHENTGEFLYQILIELFERYEKSCKKVPFQECGLTVCKTRAGELVRGSQACGSEPHKMSLTVGCPAGSLPKAIIHEHPGNNPDHSSADLEAARKSGLLICNITKSHGMTCTDGEKSYSEADF